MNNAAFSVQYTSHTCETGYTELQTIRPNTGWRRGSVVRTSVFNWQTFLDLHLIYG